MTVDVTVDTDPKVHVLPDDVPASEHDVPHGLAGESVGEELGEGLEPV